MGELEIVTTLNGYGWTSSVPNQITRALLDFLSKEAGPSPLVLDIGAGLGVGTLPFLEFGARVIALDLEESHLALIRQEAERESKSDRLTLVVGRFPGSLQFERLDAIHCSNVLHFLTGHDIELGINKMYEWLRPGGTVFLQVGTIYAGHIKRLLPIFEERRRSGVQWAGETSSAKDYVAANFRGATPCFMNYLDEAPLISLIKTSGFVIERAWYYTRTGLPKALCNDGRENFGIIATRPV